MEARRPEASRSNRKDLAMGELTPSEAAELSKIVESRSLLQAAEFEVRLAKVEKEVDHGRQQHR